MLLVDLFWPAVILVTLALGRADRRRSDGHPLRRLPAEEDIQT